MAERCYCDFYIHSSLEGLGIPVDMIDGALAKVSEEFSEEKRIRMLVEKRMGLEKKKMIRFLANRGFSFEKILNIIGGVD
jgi:SOS response regulatory protein OraA/RecX